MKLKHTTLATTVALLTTLAAPASYADIKIGFLATLSGGAAALGQDMVDGFKLALEQHEGQLGGQKIDLITEDDQMKPDLGVQAVQKLVEKDKVDLIAGVTFSNVMMAVAKPIADAKLTFIGSNAGPAPLAGKDCKEGFFFTAWQNDNLAEVMGQFAQDKGYKNVYLMAPNYQSGRDQIAGFKRLFKGEVAGEVYTQLNQPDYSAELAQLQVTAPEAIFAFFPGGMGVNFIKQFKQAGLLGKVPLLTASTVDGTQLPALKDAALGVYAGSFWGPDFDNETSKSFVKAFEEKYGRIPSQYAAQAYDSALLIDSALKKTAGKIEDKAAFHQALMAADYPSLRGSYSFSNNGFPKQNFYAFEVAKNDKDQVSLKTIATPLKDHADAYVSECKR